MDERDGLDRRVNEGQQGVTLGELYRICQRIEEQMTSLRDGIVKDVHSLRGRIDANNIAITLLQEKVTNLESKGRDWRGWISAGVIGGGLALVPFLMQWVGRR